MLVNNQIEIASYVNTILSKSENRFFTIHSVFSNAVNFCDGDLLLTFTSPDVQVSPSSVVVNESRLFNSITSLSPTGSVCDLNYPLLSFTSVSGSFSVSLETCDVVKTEMEIYNQISKKNIEQFKSNVSKAIDNCNSILNIFHNYQTEDVLMERFRTITLSIQKSIAANDTTNFRLEAKKLLGLGTGLTPAGDDFLYGLLAVWKTFDGSKNFNKELETVIVENKNEIGIISYNMLDALTKNHIFMPLKNLFQKIDSGNDYIQELSEIESFGSSSGADMMAGVLFGFENQEYKIEA